MSVLASDAFTRADAATLGANWTQAKGMGGRLGIFSNQADAATASNECGDYYSAVVWPNDQYSQVKLVSIGAGVNAGVIVRSITSGSLRNFYFGGDDHNDTGSHVPQIYKRVAGAYTSIASGGSALAGGETLYLEVQGMSLVLKVNGSTVASGTDVSLTSGTAGLLESNKLGDVAIFDDWEGGNFAAVGGILYPCVMDGLGYHFRGLA